MKPDTSSEHTETSTAIVASPAQPTTRRGRSKPAAISSGVNAAVATANPIIKMKIDGLCVHPLQQTYYGGGYSDADDAELAEDFRINGQREPVHVMPANNKAGLPANTILDGHRRRNVFKAAGAKEITVVVRNDLLNATAAQVEAEFLGPNLLRRQLHPIDKARVAKRLIELEKGGRSLSTGPGSNDARDRVGKAIGMSGRNLSRYWRLLQTPIEVQNAVRDGFIQLVVGERVVELTRKQQQEMAGRLRNLTDRKEKKRVVEEYIKKGKESVPVNIGRTCSAFIAILEVALRDIRACDKGQTPPPVTDSLENLQRIIQLANAVIEEGDRWIKERGRMLMAELDQVYAEVEPTRRAS